MVSWLQVSVPLVDRPFGLYLWPLLDQVFLRTIGYSAEEFEFVDQVTFLANGQQALAIIAVYYVVVFGGRFVMNTFNVSPLRLNALVQLHNLFLSLLLGLLMLLLVEQLVPMIARHGLFYAVCHPKAYHQKVVVIYYLNYLTKYWELLDTVFLVLARKKLLFLHVYHHGATALLCYLQLIGYTSVEWVPIVLNLWVHVVMYWYYFLAARGVRVWWKEWVTRFQIIQFVLDLGFVYFATYTHFVYRYQDLVPFLPTIGDCSGAESAAVIGCAILSLYLVLFIMFYIASYSRKPQGKKAVKGKEGPAVGVSTGVKRS